MLTATQSMVIDVLQEDIEGFHDILRSLNSPEFSYLRAANVEHFDSEEVRRALKELLLQGYVAALEANLELVLERRTNAELDFGRLEDYWFELTVKGRTSALSAQW